MSNNESSDKTIFIVDDSDVNLLTAENSLSNYYDIYTLPSAESMFEILENIIPDLILLDIEMPGMNGFEALEQLKADALTADIPVVFLTSSNDAAKEALGFDMGAVDFITKPFSEPVLLKRIKTHLDIEGLVRERTMRIQKLQNNVMTMLATMVERRDTMTGEHIKRTTRYIQLLLEAMLAQGVYSDEISQWELDIAVSSAQLHDIGKIAISELILNKPASLTSEEFEIMKTHSIVGEELMESIIDESGNEVFLYNAKLFAGSHHERWDGTGYPRGQKGDDIPLHGRIMAIVDVYDALVSDRPYKKAFSHEKSVDVIKESSGTHFDPKIVDVFLKISDSFAEVCSC